MNIQELKEKLEVIKARGGRDKEADHGDADNLLLEFVGDEKITKIYNDIEKWYA